MLGKVVRVFCCNSGPGAEVTVDPAEVGWKKVVGPLMIAAVRLSMTRPRIQRFIPYVRLCIKSSLSASVLRQQLFRAWVHNLWKNIQFDTNPGQPLYCSDRIKNLKLRWTCAGVESCQARGQEAGSCRTLVLGVTLSTSVLSKFVSVLNWSRK